MDRRKMLATTAAALFALSAPGIASADSHGEAEAGKVKCVGGNGCKGHGECATASHECSGLNSCKGKGWVYLTPDECKEAGGELAKK